MALLNYSTKIEPLKTVAEIQGLLGAKGAKSASAQYENGQPTAIFFSIDVNGAPINFRLPCNWQGVQSALKRDSSIPAKLIHKWDLRNPQQAQRIAWRIVKDWVEAQLALIESGQAEIAEVFLPYAITSNGETCFQRISANPKLLIGM